MKKIFIFLFAIVFYSTSFLTNNIFAEIKVPGSGGINYFSLHGGPARTRTWDQYIMRVLM